MARVMSFGYESKIVESSNMQHLGDLASDLRETLGALEGKRPLIFIAHSLGGLIVKEVSKAPVSLCAWLILEDHHLPPQIRADRTQDALTENQRHCLLRGAPRWYEHRDDGFDGWRWLQLRYGSKPEQRHVHGSRQSKARFQRSPWKR